MNPRRRRINRLRRKWVRLEVYNSPPPNGEVWATRDELRKIFVGKNIDSIPKGQWEKPR
jgi:hypothetical protein